MRHNIGSRPTTAQNENWLRFTGRSEELVRELYVMPTSPHCSVKLGTLPVRDIQSHQKSFSLNRLKNSNAKAVSFNQIPTFKHHQRAFALR
jgi:hypothetical protein